MKRALILLAVVLVLVSCAASSEAPEAGAWEPVIDVADVGGTVIRIYDPQYGVTCYVCARTSAITTSYWAGDAISCVETGK